MHSSRCSPAKQEAPFRLRRSVSPLQRLAITIVTLLAAVCLGRAEADTPQPPASITSPLTTDALLPGHGDEEEENDDAEPETSAPRPLSPEDRIKLQKLLRDADTDGDKILSEKEMQDWFKLLSRKFHDSWAQEEFERADIDEDGKLSLSEYKEFLSVRVEDIPTLPEEVKLRFVKADVDKGNDTAFVSSWSETLAAETRQWKGRPGTRNALLEKPAQHGPSMDQSVLLPGACNDRCPVPLGHSPFYGKTGFRHVHIASSDNALDTEEFAQYATYLPLRTPAELQHTAKDIIGAYDSDRDGVISLTEFIEKVQQDALELDDSAREANASTAPLSAPLQDDDKKAAADRHAHEEWQAEYSELDLNADGKIDSDELTKMLKQEMIVEEETYLSNIEQVSHAQLQEMKDMYPSFKSTGALSFDEITEDLQTFAESPFTAYGDLLTTTQPQGKPDISETDSTLPHLENQPPNANRANEEL